MKLKKLFALSLLALAAAPAAAQTPEQMEEMQRQMLMQPLPVDQKVRIGSLILVVTMLPVIYWKVSLKKSKK